MSRFLAFIKRLLIRNFYWLLDYAYVSFWQLAGFFSRTNTKAFLAPVKNRQSTPVILIPGIYERWPFMKPVAKVLFAHGYAVHMVEGLGYNRGTIEEMAQVVHTYVRLHKLRNCVIVAHSKGGLVGKYLLMNFNQKQAFKGMATFNTPFSGSRYASFMPFRSLRTFLPHSPFISMLATNLLVNQNIVSIYGVFDPHIPEGSYLKGAKNIRLKVYGHFRIIKSKLAHAKLLAAIRALQSARF